jgi:hypothetical protein
MVTENRDEIVTLLEELARWARFQGIQQAKQVLKGLLEDPEKGDTPKSIYHFSDGRSSEEIGKAVGVSSQTVRNYWRSWFTSGVVVPSRHYRGRFAKVFNLEDLGMSLPKPAAAKVPANQEVVEESQDNQ